jgi:hypothetical protein
MERINRERVCINKVGKLEDNWPMQSRGIRFQGLCVLAFGAFSGLILVIDIVSVYCGF